MNHSEGMNLDQENWTIYDHTLDEHAKGRMKAWNLTDFKRTHPTLYSVFMECMEEIYLVGRLGKGVDQTMKMEGSPEIQKSFTLPNGVIYDLCETQEDADHPDNLMIHDGHTGFYYYKIRMRWFVFCCEHGFVKEVPSLEDDQSFHCEKGNHQISDDSNDEWDFNAPSLESAEGMFQEELSKIDGGS